MPCRDGGPIDTYENPTTRRRLDLATRVACEALRSLDKNRLNGSSSLSKEARDWWAAHQEEDRRRERQEQQQREREALRRKARAKLTPEERKALGI